MILGVGCIIWYSFCQGLPHERPTHESFAPIESYDVFLNTSYTSPLYNKITFLEGYDLTAAVEYAFEHVLPFSQIDLAVGENKDLSHRVGLGVMLAVFLTLGIVPSHSINIYQE